jgi:dienelactone hydrolase
MLVRVRISAIVLLAVLLSVSSGPYQAAQNQMSTGNWTGGFWLEGNWVALNVAFSREKENLIGTASVVFPSYSNTLSANNVGLTSLKTDSSAIEFEIPFNQGKISLHGKQASETITGRFHYGESEGDFGLTRVIYQSPQAMEKYYGIYSVSNDRFISVFRNWGDPRTLNYIDYKSGQIGTFWPSARENEFFSGPGRAVSFPVNLRVFFNEDASGEIKTISWKSADGPQLIAQRVDVNEERITFKNGDITLGGTLILPRAKGKFPVVIVTPGDFGTNRDQLRLWAHHYVSRGIAAFIFDSRGAGESGGTVGVNSFCDVANDVLAAVGALKTRADIDAKKIGLFGFSNSAWTVTLAASRSSDVGFLILQSLSGVEPWRQETFRAETQIRVDNFPAQIQEKTAGFMRLKFEVAQTGQGWEKVQKILDESSGERWLAYTNPPRSLERLRLSYQIMTYSPVPALEKIHVPVLAYWGENDTFVPVAQSVAIFKKAMEKAGNKDYIIKIVPKGRHDLIEGDGSPSTGARWKNFPAGFWEMHTDWLRKHVVP